MPNICDILEEVAMRSPDAVALVDRHGGKTRRLRFSELDERTAGGAGALAAAGLKEGDTVLFFHPVSLELYAALLSVFRAGMTAMFVDPSAGRSFIESCCKLRRPQGFFGSPKAHLLQLSSPAIRRIPIKFHSGSYPLPGSHRWRESAPLRQRTDHTPPALITFTSGSTGHPKAVVRSHEFLIAQHRALESALHLRPGEVDLITLPVFTLANLGSGVTSVLADTDLAKPGEADVGKVARQIADEAVERIAASPAFLEAMLASPTSLASLKRIATGGAPVFPPLIKRLSAAAPRAKVAAVYGSTEAEPIAHLDSTEIARKDIDRMREGAGLLVGRPVAEIDLRIMPDHWGQPITPFPDESVFAASCLPADEIGEIVVSGDHVLQGYLDGIGDEETKFRVGDRIWHRTGDAGRLERDGRLWLLGRCAAKIDGGALYPFAVECALSFIPRLRRCAAVQHRDLKVLAVEFTPGTDEDAELATIRKLVRWAGFDQIIACKKLPVDRRHQAKIDYLKIHELLERELP